MRRIDQFIVDVITDTTFGLWKRALRLRHHAWLWWQYTFREPYAEPAQANESLILLCGYRIMPTTTMKMKCCIPMIRGLRFGVLVFFVPIRQQPETWTTCWVRWIVDPLELYLVRSAARALGPGPAPGGNHVRSSRLGANANSLRDHDDPHPVQRAIPPQRGKKEDLMSPVKATSGLLDTMSTKELTELLG
jgi:hypothetical protein